MIAKCLVVLFCLAVFAAASVIPSKGGNEIALHRTNQSHNLIVGAREYNDRLVHQEQIIKPSSLWQITTFEKTITIFGAKAITQVQALDQKMDGTGAVATVRAGGPGFNYVTLKFKSQRNHGIHFEVQIFGK